MVRGDGGIVPGTVGVRVRGAPFPLSPRLAWLSCGVMSRSVAERRGTGGHAASAGLLAVRGIAYGGSLWGWPEWWLDSGLVLGRCILLLRAVAPWCIVASGSIKARREGDIWTIHR
jgi:hypothetical protein